MKDAGKLDIAFWLRKVPIFQHLDRGVLASLARISVMVDQEADDLIFREGEPADALYVIVSGQVHIEQTYRDGRKKTLACLLPGQFFGEMAIITSQRRCATASAAEPCRLLRLDKAAFLKSLRASNDLCFAMLQVVCERLRLADGEIGTMTFHSLAGRIAVKLLELAGQFGESVPEGVRIRLDLTHNDLADLVGTNRESISKQLSRFRSEGSLVCRQRQIIIADAGKLRRWR